MHCTAQVGGEDLESEKRRGAEAQLAGRARAELERTSAPHRLARAQRTTHSRAVAAAHDALARHYRHDRLDVRPQ